VHLSPENTATLYDLVEKAGMVKNPEGAADSGRSSLKGHASSPSMGRQGRVAAAYYPRSTFGWQRGPGWGQGGPPPWFQALRGRLGQRTGTLRRLPDQWSFGVLPRLHAAMNVARGAEPSGLSRLHCHGRSLAERAVEDQTLAS
jgi:hypothetical protein